MKMKHSYFKQVFPTYIENWPESLRQLSIPQCDIVLDSDEVEFLKEACLKFSQDNRVVHAPELSNLRNRLKDAIAQFPGGAFIRLGSRSPKDSFVALWNGLRINDPIGALVMMVSGSKRILKDLILARMCLYTPHIFIRKWIDIPPWSEFRCFMRSRILVGISQYVADDTPMYPEIVDHAPEIEASIHKLFQEFRQASHLDDVVFDIFVKVDYTKSTQNFEAHLLEINPFFFKTDSCLFRWQKPDEFDGSFRYLRV